MKFKYKQTEKEAYSVSQCFINRSTGHPNFHPKTTGKAPPKQSCSHMQYSCDVKLKNDQKLWSPFFVNSFLARNPLPSAALLPMAISRGEKQEFAPLLCSSFSKLAIYILYNCTWTHYEDMLKCFKFSLKWFKFHFNKSWRLLQPGALCYFLIASLKIFI